MLNPSVVDLLNGVAEVLKTEVAGALEPGPARDQLRDAIAIIRRVARALPDLTPYLVADITDLAETLAELGVEPTPAAGAIARSTVPGLVELGALDLELRDGLASLADRNDLSEQDEATLRAALGRMNERETLLRQSPWER